MSGRRPSSNPLGGYPAEGQYGHKKGDIEAIARHVPPGTATFAEPFGGTGVVAAMAKGMGIAVATNDVMAFSALRLKVFVENDGVTLDGADVRLLTAADARREPGAIERWYGEAMGSGNAAFLDGIAASLHLLDGGMKRDVAVCLAVLCVMRRMTYPSVRFTNDGGFAGRRPIRRADLRADFRRLALDELPRLLHAGAKPCKASRGDAIAFTAGTACDVLYADPPFPTPGGLYERDLAFYDKLVHVLQGHPELVDRPYNGPVALPPHADFTKRSSALMAIKLLFKASRNVRRIIFSFNSTSAVHPHEIVTAARDWYGGLSACEWQPGRIPTTGGRRRMTANSLMVFDRGRPTASPRWNPGDITFADIFCGVGGFRLALRSAGCRCVFSSEIGPEARAVYFANHGEWPSGDIRLVSPDDVPEHLVLCAGFPCPAFSISGKGRGYADERGMLFFEIARIAAVRRPCVLFLENVPAFASPDKPWLLLAKETLEGIGYRVFCEVIGAGLHGARTVRERAYLVCVRKDLGITTFEFPKPTFEPLRLADVLLPDSETDACVVDDPRIVIDTDAVAGAEREPPLGLMQVGGVYDADGKAAQGNRVYHPRGLAVTFCASSGGLGASTGLYLINGRVRTLHPRECARAMGFPDSFVLPPSVSAEQARRLFGNSVVVPVVRRIFDRISETLSRKHPALPHPLTCP